MATWQNTSLIMLRTMLNDAGCGEAKYSNSRLEQLLITINPDPVGQADGTEFINFMVLKAACIADEGNFRNSALLQGVKARCGPAVLDTGAYGQYLKDLLTAGPCKSYEDLKDGYNFSYEGKRILRAVMSPFVSNDFYPPMGGGGDQAPQNVYW